MLTNERITEIGDELDAEPNHPIDTLLWNQEFAKRILKEAKTESYDLGYQDGHMTATAQFNTDEHINRIKAQAVEEARDNARNRVGMSGRTYSALTKYANKLRGEEWKNIN